MRLKVFPKNKEYFIKLKDFCKEIINICKELNITPFVWGGLAYFVYTKDKNYIIQDIDLLVPNDSMKKVIKMLKKKRIRHKYLPDWNSLIIYKGKLRIELDYVEWYYKGPKKFKEVDFGDLTLKVVSLDSLTKMYKRASEVSKDKPKQHLKRFNALKKLK